MKSFGELRGRAARGAVRRKKPLPVPTSFRAHACVVLAIDPGQTSGWAISVRGELISSGECSIDNSIAVSGVCKQAREAAIAHALPAVLVLEKPFGGSVQTITGIGQRRGAWRAQWIAAGGNKTKQVNVGTSTYRSKVLGAGNLDRAAARPLEQALAASRVGRGDVGPDQAAAVCINVWAAKAPEVAAKIAARYRWAA